MASALPVLHAENGTVKHSVKQQEDEGSGKGWRKSTNSSSFSPRSSYTNASRNTRSKSISRTYGPTLGIPRTYTYKLTSRVSSRCKDRAEKSGHQLSHIVCVFTETGLDHIHAPEQIKATTGILLLPGVFRAAGLSRPRSEL